MAARKRSDAFTTEGEEVSLDDILASNTFQVRDRLDGAAVKRYAAAMRSAKVFPPITLARITGAEGLFLIDGFHRYEAAKLAGLGRLRATVEDMSPEEALWRAASANLKHGLPLTSRKERRALFDAYIRARRYRKDRGGAKSLREISEDLEGAVNFSTVRKWLMADYPSIYARHFTREEGGEGDGPFDPLALAAKARERALDDAFATVRKVYARLPSEIERTDLKRRIASLARDIGKASKGEADEDF